LLIAETIDFIASSFFLLPSSLCYSNLGGLFVLFVTFSRPRLIPSESIALQSEGTSQRENRRDISRGIPEKFLVKKGLILENENRSIKVNINLRLLERETLRQ
jgi:hypothetical protein